jgi:hypothetical protein
MDVTIHALERIIERTRMTPKDVLAIIQAGASVSLGMVDKHEFFLFWSPFDNKHKIAILGNDNKKLITVWETHFRLPKQTKKITSGRKRLSRNKFQEFMKQRVIKKETVCPQTLDVLIEVLQGHKKIFAHNVGLFSFPKAPSRNGTIRLLREPLTVIVDTLEQHATESSLNMSIDLLLLDPESNVTKTFFKISVPMIKMKLKSLK